MLTVVTVVKGTVYDYCMLTVSSVTEQQILLDVDSCDSGDRNSLYCTLRVSAVTV